MEGRPDERDFDVAKEYVERTYTRFINEDENLLGELEKTEYPKELLDAAEASRFKVLTLLPTRGGQECGMCLECEELCPTGAIKAESGEADKGRCIACLACVANCPEQVLEINDMSKSWPFKLKKKNATEESLKDVLIRIVDSRIAPRWEFLRRPFRSIPRAATRSSDRCRRRSARRCWPPPGADRGAR